MFYSNFATLHDSLNDRGSIWREVTLSEPNPQLKHMFSMCSETHFSMGVILPSLPPTYAQPS